MLKVQNLQNKCDVMLFFQPEGMYHGTINLGDTVALGIQKIKPASMVMQHIYDGEKYLLYKALYCVSVMGSLLQSCP